ncbi:MAG: peptide chain release factor N(5)-glutamine methyltransferase [Ruminococcus sp.]|nr:peptide chain release factor N(5)-glutamine methyltransferase [Ruminococcus sp.]
MMNLQQAKLLLKRELNHQEAVGIITFVTGLDNIGQMINSNKELTEELCLQIDEIIKLRQNGYPLQYILGSWSFMGNEFAVGEGVLIPRDDTEVAVNSVLPFLRSKKNPKVIDLCSGSGIIAITIKKYFPNAEVHAVELSSPALIYLEKNIQTIASDVKLHRGDVDKIYSEFSDNVFDLIISNPPYIPSAELKDLQIEVRSEPEMALDGGSDGLDFYRSITKNWSSKLKSGGMLAFELGEEQYEAVCSMMTQEGFTNINGYKDLGNTIRAINAIKR